MVRPLTSTVLFMLVGCGGPNDETLVDELRVLAMVPGAPEIAPGETTTLQTRVVDPEGLGGSALVWTCTYTGETCLEDEVGRSPEVLPLGDGRLSTEVVASSALAALATEEPVPLVAVWALACQDGLCPILDAVEAGEAVPADQWADPFDWMDELPMQGVSLATISLDISTRPEGERHPAPSLSATPEIEATAPGDTLPVDALAAGELGEEARIWAYATDGGFVSTDERPDASGAATLDWVAPESVTEAEAWLVLVDGLGGTALWEGALRVE